MRILVVHHGALAPLIGPTSGGAIRALAHVVALRGAGHEVLTLARAQDGPGGFTGPAHLRALARRAAPDWTLCVALEEAPGLAGLAPLVVDLYAPRLLEAAFEGQQEDEAKRVLLAVHAADDVLFSNPRQRHFWLGVLGLAGWDLRGAAGHVVPLGTVPVARVRKPKRPRVILGGQPWPWQDASEVLKRAVAHLGGRADVVTYGLPAMEGVESHGLVSRAEWLSAVAGSTVALDRYAPHIERELALSFRQLDYLSAGIPVITDPWAPIADDVRRHAAGWVDEPLEAALDAALHEDRGAGARALCDTFSSADVSARLVELRPTRRVREWSVVSWSRRASAAMLGAEADRVRREAAEAEVFAKREEVAALVGQLRALTAAMEQLSAAQADIAGFRRETVQVLGTRLAGQTEEAEALRQQLAQLRAERDRLGGVLRRLSGPR